MGELHGRFGHAQARFAGGGFLGHIAVGHHYDHGAGLSGSNQVVEDLGGASQGDPGLLVAAHAVKQVEHWKFILRRFIARRGIDGHTAGHFIAGRGVPAAGHRAMRHRAHLIEISFSVPRDKDVEDGGHVADQVDISRVGTAHAVDREPVAVEVGTQGSSRMAPYPLFIFGQHYRSGPPPFGGHPVPRELHLTGIRSHQPEGDRLVGMDFRRNNFRSAPQCLLCIKGHAR